MKRVDFLSRNENKRLVNVLIFCHSLQLVHFHSIPANCEREKGSVKPKFATNNIEKKKHGNHSERHQMCMQFVLLVFIMKRTPATASPSFFNTNKMPKKQKVTLAHINTPHPYSMTLEFNGKTQQIACEQVYCTHIPTHCAQAN